MSSKKYTIESRLHPEYRAKAQVGDMFWRTVLCNWVEWKTHGRYETRKQRDQALENLQKKNRNAVCQFQKMWEYRLGRE